MAPKTHVPTLRDPCPQTGRPCEVAQALLDALALAMVQAEDVVGPGFSLTGAVETRACGHACRLRWSGTDAVIAVDMPFPRPDRGPALRAERLRGRLA